ncbi:MAG: asparaginase [Acidimicrobiia bacterium]
MRFERVRSGLTESSDEVEAVAINREGDVLYSSGDVHRPIFYRSAIKPFQALAARRTGLELPAEHLAVSCASHGGHPVHLAIVRRILDDAGLAESSLRCTPGRPRARSADVLRIAAGDMKRRPILHTCSGKHAGWLAACARAGWDTGTYLAENHPLQRLIVDVVADATGVDPEPTGVDGCGAPTLRGTITGLATAFSRFGTDAETAPIASAMGRFGSLVSDNTMDEGSVAAMWGGTIKCGAEGLLAMERGGVAIVTKSISGDDTNALAAALRVAERLGMLTPAMIDAIARPLAPPVLGAGKPVGVLELVE